VYLPIYKCHLCVCNTSIHLIVSGLLNLRDANTDNIMHTFHMVFLQLKEGWSVYICNLHGANKKWEMHWAWAWVPKLLANLMQMCYSTHCQDDMHNTHNRFWLIAGDWAIRVGGSNSHIHMEVQCHKCTTPSLKRLRIKKIYSQILFDQAT